jgi:hypothetical protein
MQFFSGLTQVFSDPTQAFYRRPGDSVFSPIQRKAGAQIHPPERLPLPDCPFPIALPRLPWFCGHPY